MTTTTDISVLSEKDCLPDTPWRNITMRREPERQTVHNEDEMNQESQPYWERASHKVPQSSSGRAFALFMCGICLAMFGLTTLGVLFELCGFCILLCEPVLFGLSTRIPYIGALVSAAKAKQIRDSLKTEAETYEPLKDLLRGEAHFPHVNILLLGPVGAGKSSFLNTMHSIFRDKIFNVARCGSSEHSLTMKFTRNDLISKRTSELLQVRMWDTRGIENGQLMEKENMKYMLQGNIPNKFMLNQHTSISPQTPGFIELPSLEDVMHCVAIVIDASMVDAADAIKDTIRNIKEMQTLMNLYDVPQVIVLTNIDKVCQHTKHDACNALKSKLIAETVGKVSDMFGLAKHCIFPMKNYEKECELDPNMDILALLALRGILNNADAFLFPYRKEILQNYAALTR
ncbi:interferon-induced protein 44-like [Mercenaria mercenaria]|uniref:interferon-induced protein 44-like n=1 Tax=Mercenaria mercenaria TaxID=6596 RepID=UPI00234F76D2|nr:interferon-induced protein 44-like [Mercenaria mercenaria]